MIPVAIHKEAEGTMASKTEHETLAMRQHTDDKAAPINANEAFRMVMELSAERRSVAETDGKHPLLFVHMICS